MSAPNPRHVPVLLERCVALLAPAVTGPGAVRRRRDARARRAQRGAPAAVPRAAARRPRPRPRGARPVQAHGSPRSPTGSRSCTRSTTSCPTVLAGLGLATGRRRPVRPRRLVAAARRGRPRVLLRAGRARSTCGWTRRGGMTAADVLNTYPAAELARVLREYGEERFARRIADRVVRDARGRAVRRGPPGWSSWSARPIPAATRRTGGNPAKRTFQALRIEVNGELAALERALPAAVAALAVGGRIVVLSYQSLEDRLVKRVLGSGASTTAPPDLPVVPEALQPRLRLLTRGAETADADEVADQPAGRVGAAARRRADPGGRMSAVPGPAETGARAARTQAQRTARGRGPAAARGAGGATRASSGAFVLLLTGLLGRRPARPARAEHRAGAGLLRDQRPGRQAGRAGPAGAAAPAAGRAAASRRSSSR